MCGDCKLDEKNYYGMCVLGDLAAWDSHGEIRNYPLPPTFCIPCLQYPNFINFHLKNKKTKIR